MLPGDDEPVRYQKAHPGAVPRPGTVDRCAPPSTCSDDDVRTHADAILDRVRNGSMPCDGAWPAEKIDAFQRWVSAGPRRDCSSPGRRRARCAVEVVRGGTRPRARASRRRDTRAPGRLLAFAASSCRSARPRVHPRPSPRRHQVDRGRDST